MSKFDFTTTDPLIIAKWLFRYNGHGYRSNSSPPQPGQVAPPTDDIKFAATRQEFAEQVQKNIANWIKYEREMAAFKGNQHVR